MSDNLDMTPQLTLTPEADTAAAAAPAAAPTLTLEPAAADPADEAAAQKDRTLTPSSWMRPAHGGGTEDGG